MSTLPADRRIVCVLTGIPERRTGNGILLFEVLAFLATRGKLAAVMPAAKPLREEFAEACADPLLAGIERRPLKEFCVPGLRGAIQRLLAPAEVTKYAAEHNQRILSHMRDE
jgi:hypothetical protein